MPIDYSKYHPQWHRISEYIRFVRAGNRCERCGAENYQPHPRTGSKVVLTVAHLDHDTDNNHTDNLAALCQACHLAQDADYHAANRKYGKGRNGNHQLRLSL